jgi:serine protease Do
VSIQDVTPDLAKSLGFERTEGALVSGVMNNSPAEKAGFKRGDLIIALGSKKIEDSTCLRNLVAATAPGTKVEATIVRNGKERTIAVTLGEYKEKKEVRQTTTNNVLRGVTVQEITPEAQRKLDLPENATGVVVTDVSPDSPAQGLLEPNDAILEVNRQEINGLHDYDKLVSKLGEKDPVLLLLFRDGGSLYLTIRP